MGRSFFAGQQPHRVCLAGSGPAGGLCPDIRIHPRAACSWRKASGFGGWSLASSLARRWPRALLRWPGQPDARSSRPRAARIWRAQSSVPHPRSLPIQHHQGLSIRCFTRWPTVHHAHDRFHPPASLHSDRKLAGKIPTLVAEIHPCAHYPNQMLFLNTVVLAHCLRRLASIAKSQGAA